MQSHPISIWQEVTETCTGHALAYGVAESVEQPFLVRPEFAAERIHYFVRILTRDLVRQMDSLVAVRVRGLRGGALEFSFSAPKGLGLWSALELPWRPIGSLKFILCLAVSVYAKLLLLL